MTSLHGSVFDSQQTSSGVALSLCIPLICYGATTVGVNAAQSQITGNYLSVTEQSGLKAGDGGFQVSVRGNTELIGGVIASSDAAIAQGRNSFSSATVTQRDIENRVEFKGEAFAVSVNTGTGTQQSQGSAYANNGQASASAGIGSDQGFQTSLTRSAIGASTREYTAGVIAPIFDADKVQRNLNAQVRITQTFSQVAPKAVADYAGRQTRPVDDARQYELLREQQRSGQTLSEQDARALAELQGRGMNDAQAQATLSDPKALQNYNHWQEGGTYRVALHTAIGALGGGVNGALGAGVNAAAAPVLDDLQFNVRQQLIDSGISAGTAQVISQGAAQLTSAGIGATVGGTAGAGFGLAVDTNNRQLHRREVDWIKAHARRFAQQQGISEAEAEQRLADQAFRQVQFGAAGSEDAAARSFLRQAGNQLLPGDPSVAGANVGYLFQATPTQRADASMYWQGSLSDPVMQSFYREHGIHQPTIDQIAQAAGRDANARVVIAQQTIGAAIAAGALTLAPALSGVAAEVTAFARDPVGYCTANPAGCTVGAEAAACGAAGAACPPSSLVPTVGIRGTQSAAAEAEALRRIGANNGSAAARTDHALLNASDQALARDLSDRARIGPDTSRDAFYAVNTDASILANNRFDMQHVLSGEINAAGRATGYHAEFAADGAARIAPGATVTQNTNGTYRVPVQIWDDSTRQWVDKVDRRGNPLASTFFPPSWSEVRVTYEVTEAFRQGTPGTSFEAVTPSGIWIRFHWDPRNQRTTFFPTGN